MKNSFKLLFLILVGFFSNYSCFSQDKSLHKVVYQFDMVRDTLSMELFRQELYIVQIGNGITKGFTYQKFYLDSLKAHDPNLYHKLFSASVQESIEEWKRTGDISHVRNSKFHSGPFTSVIHKDYRKNEIRIQNNIQTQNFIYTDELKPQEWEILSDTAIILGYLSQKARCHFRGRDYEAWFTTEIPISEGPWKFHGLPGLITKIHDTKNHYRFVLAGFQKNEEPIDTNIPRNARKIERGEFLRAKFGEQGEMVSNLEMTTVGLPSNSAVERNFDYIELDH